MQVNNLNLAKSQAQSQQNPQFQGKVETKTVIECICGIPFEDTPLAHFSRNCDIAEITGIKEQVLNTKSMPMLEYCHFLENIGQRIMENYKEFKPVKTAYQNMGVKLFSSKMAKLNPQERAVQLAKMNNEERLNEFANEYIKKYGEVVDITLPEGEKSFIGKMFDMTF